MIHINGTTDMNRRRQIIVFFEDLEVRKDAVNFAVGLAERTDSEIIFLLLLESDCNSIEKNELLSEKYHEVMTHHLNSLIKSTTKKSIIVRIGDPISEFYKCMTEYPSIGNAVWGGNENILKKKSGLDSNHWLSQVEQELECPLIIPKRKSGS